jgi:hypothetical protein
MRPTTSVPALAELADRLQQNGISTNPRLIAGVILEIASDKLPNDRALIGWVHQLAVDVQEDFALATLSVT